MKYEQRAREREQSNEDYNDCNGNVNQEVEVHDENNMPDMDEPDVNGPATGREDRGMSKTDMNFNSVDKMVQNDCPQTSSTLLQIQSRDGDEKQRRASQVMSQDDVAAIQSPSQTEDQHDE